MITALLLAAAAPSAVDAERAFARDAQRIGQWSAFARYADHDAVMFTPQAVWARDFLKGRKDPPKSVSWRPSDSFVSCDSRTAVNTGPWLQGDGKPGGYFITIWQLGRKGWRWVYDGGVPTPIGKPGSRSPIVHRASCSGRAPGAPIAPPPKLSRKQARTTPEDNGRGQSADRTLGWDWKVAPDGERTLRVFLWSKGRYREVIHGIDPAK
ncbi:MAG TPA: hypothetical protein VHE36_05455 [Sphingomicrobium sp.]|nr:hypothetical protein [Sphingomicrobium sp.]